MQYPIHENAVALIKHFEGRHNGDLGAIGLQPKMCPAGIWTVGWGHALTDPRTGQFLRGSKDKAHAYGMYPSLTETDADRLLAEDLAGYARETRRVVTVSVPDHAMGALTSFAFNLGTGALKKSTLLSLLNNGNTVEAADQFLRWNKASGKVLPGLTRRREAERHLFLTGELVLRIKQQDGSEV